MRYAILLFAILCAPLSAAPRMVVGIAGGTGSGKSTLSDTLLKTFGEKAVLIRQDDYYKDLGFMPEQERTRQNFDHPDAIDFALLHNHLVQLKNNASIEVPIYNFCRNTRESDTHMVAPAEIIIVEGILLFSIPEIRELFDLKIFVETDDDIRLLRRIERDTKERGRDLASIRSQYLATVKPMHDAFVEPSKRYADIIIPTLQRNDNAVALLISGIREAMAEAKVN
jgi:uridine kinase